MAGKNWKLTDSSLLRELLGGSLTADQSQTNGVHALIRRVNSEAFAVQIQK